ncbi:uncharacterized protein Dana_GF27871 [Drosophila ananassae]|uniref:Uncharacterized protein n=1 Tax=Drosophila ananassae TaxID=7217 RepID=A0A0P8YHM8_DROAN|nr:uncharacterized protein Dana_GF27871 [Drosophila ananassae]
MPRNDIPVWVVPLKGPARKHTSPLTPETSHILDHRKMSHKSEKRRSGSEKLHKVKTYDSMKKQKKRALKKLRRKEAGPNFSYQLFLYRQELRRSHSDFSYLRLSKAKINLTSELIARHLVSGKPLRTVEELKELSREVQFKKRLAHQVERLQQFRQLGLTEMILNGKRTTL